MNDTTSADLFRARVGNQFDTPGEAVDALLEGGARMPDPTDTLGASYAVAATAKQLAEALQNPHALYSLQQAAEFLADAAAVLHAFTTALPRAVEAAQAAQGRGDVPDDAQAELDSCAESMADVREDIQWLARRVESTSRSIAGVDYAGYTDQGRAHQFAGVVSGLERAGASIDVTQVPEGDGNGVVEFTLRGLQYALVDDRSSFTGWELFAIENDEFQRVDMPEAHTSAVHSAAIVKGAIEAIRRGESTDSAA